MLSLETKRLIIRELTAADFDDYFTIIHQKEIHPYLSHITTNRDVEYARFVSYIQMVYGFYGFGLWGIFKKDSGTLIGQAGLECQSIDEESEIMLSYFLDRRYRSCGYAAEACRKILEYAREELEFDRITAVIAPDNKASIRLAGKLGFTFVKDTVYQNQTCRLYVNEEGTEA